MDTETSFPNLHTFFVSDQPPYGEGVELAILTGSFLSNRPGICLELLRFKAFFFILWLFPLDNCLQNLSQLGINFIFSVCLRMILVSVLCFPLSLISIYTLDWVFSIMVGDRTKKGETWVSVWLVNLRSNRALPRVCVTWIWWIQDILGFKKGEYTGRHFALLICSVCLMTRLLRSLSIRLCQLLQESLLVLLRGCGRIYEKVCRSVMWLIICIPNKWIGIIHLLITIF